MNRMLILCVVAVLLSLSVAASTLAQQPAPTPTPLPITSTQQAVLDRADDVLNRANEVASLAEGTVEQTSRTVELAEKLAWVFTGFIAVAVAFLGWYGFSSQRGFQDTLDAYKNQLDQMKATFQENLSLYQTEQKQVQALQLEMEKKIREIEAIRQELNEIKETVTQEFTATKQAMVLLGMGNRLFNAGKRDQAIDIYEEAQRLVPDDSQINYRLGRAYSNAGRYKEAIEALETAVYGKPDFAEAHMELGLAYRRHAESTKSADERLAEYRLAERYLIRALRLRPEYEDALGAMGGLKRREGRYREALHYYKRAARVDPNSSYALNNIASLAWYLGESELAREAFERVEVVASERIQADVEEDFWAYYDRGLARLVLGRWDDALGDHTRAIARTPEKENLRSVLDNLNFLKGAKNEINGLDKFISMVKDKLF